MSVASVDEKSISIFQYIARDHPFGGDDFGTRNRSERSHREQRISSMVMWRAMSANDLLVIFHRLRWAILWRAAVSNRMALWSPRLRAQTHLRSAENQGRGRHETTQARSLESDGRGPPDTFGFVSFCRNSALILDAVVNVRR
jgi:hypothetical protein